MDTPLTSSRILRRAYTLWAPFYDAVVDAPFRESRKRSLAGLGDVHGQRILLDGIGTGLDLRFLPRGAMYAGLDLTPAMLRRARRRAQTLNLQMNFFVGDAMALPFRDAAFDHVVMHLILAVVPDTRAALAEAARVVTVGGRIHLLDKFLRPGQRAPLRRLLSPIVGRLATRTDVVFEDVLAACPGLEVIGDEPDIGGGWFRRIVLRRNR
jgi:ubiquinone/menaquinone biosynthesis C-methylase UbiE